MMTMNQLPMFDLDTIREKTEVTPLKKPERRIWWAVYRERDGILYVLYQTHSDEVTWMRTDVPRVPHLYKTERGAWRAAKELDGAYATTWEAGKR